MSLSRALNPFFTTFFLFPGHPGEWMRLVSLVPMISNYGHENNARAALRSNLKRQLVAVASAKCRREVVFS
jgi:hypothetical protein